MKSFRPERVAAVVREIVSEAIATKLSDPRIAPMSSVTRVEVSRDLEHARVYVSVLGDDAAARRTLAGLASAGGYVQRMVGKQLQVRQCPQLTFHLDESLKKAAEMIRLIDQVTSESRGDAEKPPEPDAGDSRQTSSGDDA